MINDALGFSDIDLALEIYGIGDKEIKAIQNYRNDAYKLIPNFISDFYVWLPRVPEYEQLFSRPGLVESIKKKQTIYWQQFFDYDFDQDYLQTRFKVGQVHATINLPVSSYVAGMNFSATWWFNKINAIKSKKVDIPFLVSYINKGLSLETAIVSAAYTKASNDLIEKQSRALIELSTPTIQLWEGILVLPILGVLDSRRAQDMTDVMLNKIQQTNASVIIIDITGVPTVDSSVANHLIKITKATRLMGCECILSGIGPEIAQTLVHLGISLDSIETSSNLKSAFHAALTKNGYRMLSQSSKSNDGKE